MFAKRRHYDIKSRQTLTTLNDFSSLGFSDLSTKTRFYAPQEPPTTTPRRNLSPLPPDAFYWEIDDETVCRANASVAKKFADAIKYREQHYAR